MNAIATYYHAHPVVWTTVTILLAYVYGKGETERKLDQWREWHRRTFRCEPRPGQPGDRH